jgi:hypothetical protein
VCVVVYNAFHSPDSLGRHDTQAHNRAEPEIRVPDRFERSYHETEHQLAQPPNQREARRQPPAVGERHMPPQDLETDDDEFPLPRNHRGEVVGASFSRYPTRPGK